MDFHLDVIYGIITSILFYLNVYVLRQFLIKYIPLSCLVQTVEYVMNLIIIVSIIILYYFILNHKTCVTHVIVILIYDFQSDISSHYY